MVFSELINRGFEMKKRSAADLAKEIRDLANSNVDLLQSDGAKQSPRIPSKTNRGVLKQTTKAAQRIFNQMVADGFDFREIDAVVAMVQALSSVAHIALVNEVNDRAVRRAREVS